MTIFEKKLLLEISLNGFDFIEELIHEAISKEMGDELHKLAKKYRTEKSMTFYESYERAYYDLEINEI